MGDAIYLGRERLQSRELPLDRRRAKLKLSLPDPGQQYASPGGAAKRLSLSQSSRRTQIEAWLSLDDHLPSSRACPQATAAILPSSPSTVSAGRTSFATPSDSWHRTSLSTEKTEFEDIYDVSEPEDAGMPACRHRSSCLQPFPRDARKGRASRSGTRLMIPKSQTTVDEAWPPILTPASTLSLSPAQVNFMGMQQSLRDPTTSTPPSLDGSLTSEQLALMSGPSTPVAEDVPWSGVHLQPEAEATLQALFGSDGPTTPESASPTLQDLSSSTEPLCGIRREPPAAPVSAENSDRRRWHQLCPVDLTRLEIPSPAGFFSDFSPRGRSLWRIPVKTSCQLSTPTTAAAEQFYRVPWANEAYASPRPQQASMVQPTIDSCGFGVSTMKTAAEKERNSVAGEQTALLSALDRTNHWLLAQMAFSNVENRMENMLDPGMAAPADESAYYRTFRSCIAHQAWLGDVFVHQLPRFEALQAQRVALRERHRNQLLGNHQLDVAAQYTKRRLSANVARGDLVPTIDPEDLRKGVEREARDQMAMPTWHVAATRLLNGGRLISAPKTKQLAQSCRSDRLCDKPGREVSRGKILDLGGQPAFDWAWHCANEFPSVKVVTVTTKARGQLSNTIQGPPNHCQVMVERLTRLPFADNHFDLVSARELQSILRRVGEDGEDEWDSCLGECLRVLKPGGYLEFSILDSDIINAGPLGLAKSVEFGYTLSILGYDPSPTKTWLERLSRAGFDRVRRAWMCLPIGARSKKQPGCRPNAVDGTGLGQGQQNCHNRKDDWELGNSDNVASICSLVGGWRWERWLLRCEMEKAAGRMRLVDAMGTPEAMSLVEASECLDGVHAVIEEGRSCNAALRMLNGYARKPKTDDSEVIRIGLAQG